MLAPRRGPAGNPPQDTGSVFCALRNLGQARSGAPTGGSGGESAANTSPFTLMRDLSKELFLGGFTEYGELERVERDNLDSEGASARFRSSDPIFDM